MADIIPGFGPRPSAGRDVLQGGDVETPQEAAGVAAQQAIADAAASNSTFGTIVGDLTWLGAGGALLAPAFGAAGVAGDATAAGAADAGVPAAVASTALPTTVDTGVIDLSGGAGALGGGAAAAGGAGAAGATGALPSAAGDVGGVTVTGAPFTGGSAVSDLMPGAFAGAGALASGTGGGNSFLPATGAGDISNLSPALTQSLGIDPSTNFVSSGAGISPGGGSDFALPDVTYHPSEEQSFGDSVMQWLKNPKNAATAGMLGVSGFNALSHPKLPGSARQAGGIASANITAAESVIQSGGTAGPAWAQQKASIDASIDQQIKQATEQMEQAAINSGMGNQNSGVVQQQIAEIKSRADTQRQQLYLQAQNQNVQQAIAELTGDNQVLMGIANMQLNEDASARQAAEQTAYLALLLQGLG